MQTEYAPLTGISTFAKSDIHLCLTRYYGIHTGFADSEIFL